MGPDTPGNKLADKTDPRAEVERLWLMPMNRRVEAAAEAILAHMHRTGGTRRGKAFFLARLALAAADGVPDDQKELPAIRKPTG